MLDALDARLGADPDGVYLDFEGEAWSASRIDEVSRRLASGLSDLGVSPGDRVATLLGNGAPQVLSLFATVQLGAVWVPVNTAFKGEFLAHQLRDSGAQILIATDDLVPRAVAVAGTDTPDLERLVVVGGDVDTGSLDTTRWADLERSASAASANPQPADLAMLIYTAGTTGPSKGCMLPHNYVASMSNQIARIWERRSDDIVWTPLPLFHLNAVAAAVMGPLLVGGSASVSSRFSVSGFWSEVRRSGATIASLLGSPAMLIAEADDHPDMAGHQLRLCAAAPMPPAIDAIWRERFGCRTFSAGFGLTEASLLSLTPAGEPNPPGAAGRLNDTEFEVRIVDDDDTEVSEGSTGEIVCRPRAPDVMFAGYWRRPEATVEVMRNLWFHTGDLGRVDDGYLFFVDRKKDYLRRRGENISSFELEKALFAHEAIADCAVHAVPSDQGEDDVKVTAVLTRAGAVTEEELCVWLADRVPYFAVPRYIEFRDDLPRNPVGRVLKFQLRDEGVTTRSWDRELSGLVIER